MIKIDLMRTLIPDRDRISNEIILNLIWVENGNVVIIAKNVININIKVHIE